MSTIVHLVRHGEVFNPDRILYGRLPGYHLSDRGRVMASMCARAFTDHDVTVVKASPLVRAQETAEPFQKVTGVDIWNINADEQIAFEYSRYNYTAEDLYRPDQWRSSDHDPVKVGLQLDLTPGHGGPNPGKGKGRGNR